MFYSSMGPTALDDMVNKLAWPVGRHRNLTGLFLTMAGCLSSNSSRTKAGRKPGTVAPVFYLVLASDAWLDFFRIDSIPQVVVSPGTLESQRAWVHIPVLTPIGFGTPRKLFNFSTLWFFSSLKWRKRNTLHYCSAHFQSSSTYHLVLQMPIHCLSLWC